MSYNKYGEIKLLQDLTHSKPYFVSRDRAGFYVLREGNSNGKEIFATHKDDGKKNSKKDRVYDVGLLINKMMECEH